MAKRMIAPIAFVLLIASCGGGPSYTVRQAEIDLPSYEHAVSPNDDQCIAEYLFDRMPPARVKSIIQGADTGFLPSVMTAAANDCANGSRFGS